MPWLIKHFDDDPGHASRYLCDKHADELLDAPPPPGELPWQIDDGPGLAEAEARGVFNCEHPDCGFGQPDDGPHCDGQGGWLAGDDPAPGVALWPAMRNDRDFWRASEEEW